MMDSRHLISWSILKIFLSTTQPWIYFFSDIDTLKDVCDIFMILCDHLLFKKNSFMHATLFLPNLDFLELLGVFTTICHLNECMDFGMLF